MNETVEACKYRKRVEFEEKRAHPNWGQNVVVDYWCWHNSNLSGHPAAPKKREPKKACDILLKTDNCPMGYKL